MPMELIFETHSLTLDNASGVATGWRDGRLSERGRGLAAELGRRRRDVDAVFSSDLGRAVETVDIAFGGSGIPVHLDRRLRECDYGELTGMSTARLAEERQRRVEEPFPGGESYRDVVARMSAFLVEVGARPAPEWGSAGGRIVVVGHTATRWALDHLLLGTPLLEAVRAPFAWREGWSYRLPAGWRLR
jgi:broad specificity phosphatase PhoE